MIKKKSSFLLIFRFDDFTTHGFIVSSIKKRTGRGRKYV